LLGTSSSEAALPSLMLKLEKWAVPNPSWALSVPAGYSFNLDGTSMYLSMATLFLAQVYGIQLSWEQLLTIIGVLMVTSKGAAGVTGSGFVVLASTLTALQVIPLEGLALLLGVDRFMSEARAITNFIGNGVATIWLAKHEGEFQAPESVYGYPANTLRRFDWASVGFAGPALNRVLILHACALQMALASGSISKPPLPLGRAISKSNTSPRRRYFFNKVFRTLHELRNVQGQSIHRN
jgi:hypothetical protein